MSFFLAFLQKIGQPGPNRLNVLDLIHGTGDPRIRGKRLVLLVQFGNGYRAVEPTRADDLHAIRVDFNLNASNARIVSVGYCVVDGLGDQISLFSISLR